MNIKLKILEKKTILARNNLYKLLNKHTSLDGPEVIKASQKLDKILNEYNQLKKAYEDKKTATGEAIETQVNLIL